MKIKKNLALSDSGFVFDPATGNSFSTNPIGLEIIQMMKRGKNLKEIETAILQKYQVDPVTLERDLYDFNQVLQKMKLGEDHAREKN